MTDPREAAYQRAYREQSDDYGAWEVPGVLESLPRSRDATFTLLELGCGLGHTAALIKQAYPNATVIAGDVVEECLEKIRGRYPELETVWLNADRELPLANASVDYVFSSNLFEHLFDDEVHLREVGRILRRGGEYIVSTPSFWPDLVYYSVLRPGQPRTLQVVWHGIRGRFTHDPDIGHCNLQTPRSLSRRFTDTGFEPRVVRRDTLSETERTKLRELFSWLPGGAGDRLSKSVERLWLRLPAGIHPSIVVVGRKTS